MKLAPILLIIFGSINIIFPDILAYVLGGTCIAIGVGMLLGNYTKFGNKKNQEPYVKFGNYKIFR